MSGTDPSDLGLRPGNRGPSPFLVQPKRAKEGQRGPERAREGRKTGDDDDRNGD